MALRRVPTLSRATRNFSEFSASEGQELDVLEQDASGEFFRVRALKARKYREEGMVSVAEGWIRHTYLEWPAESQELVAASVPVPRMPPAYDPTAHDISSNEITTPAPHVPLDSAMFETSSDEIDIAEAQEDLLSLSGSDREEVDASSSEYEPEDAQPVQAMSGDHSAEATLEAHPPMTSEGGLGHAQASVDIGLHLTESAMADLQSSAELEGMH